MARTFGTHSLLALCFSALLSNGCGDDAKKKGVHESQDPAKGDDAGENDDAGSKTDAAAEDDDEKPRPMDPVDAGVNPGPNAEQGSSGTLLTLPNDGKHLSICYGHADCTGEGLECYGAFRMAPGFCSALCEADDDCSPIAGLKAGCGPDGQCRVDCSGADDKGDGACPSNMVCRDFFDLAVVGGGAPSEPGLITMWRCGYPVDGGSNRVAAYQRCDLSHGHGDCKGDLLCHAPSSRLGRPANPGYCSERCADASDCAAPSGTTAAPVCQAGACELDCAAAGATCPSGMNCRQVGASSQVHRCRFIAE